MLSCSLTAIPSRTSSPGAHRENRCTQRGWTCGLQGYYWAVQSLLKALPFGSSYLRGFIGFYQAKLRVLDFFHSLFIGYFVFESLFQVLPDVFDFPYIFLGVFPELLVPDRDLLGFDKPLLLKVVELLPWNIYFRKQVRSPYAHPVVYSCLLCKERTFLSLTLILLQV